MVIQEPLIKIDLPARFNPEKDIDLDGFYERLNEEIESLKAIDDSKNLTEFGMNYVVAIFFGEWKAWLCILRDLSPIIKAELKKKRKNE